MVLAPRTPQYSPVDISNLSVSFKYGTRFFRPATPRALAWCVVASGHVFSFQISTNNPQIKTDCGFTQGISDSGLTWPKPFSALCYEHDLPLTFFLFGFYYALCTKGCALCGELADSYPSRPGIDVVLNASRGLQKPNCNLLPLPGSDST
jgi:hypothetical protein